MALLTRARRAPLRAALRIEADERLVVRAASFGAKPVFYRPRPDGSTVVSSSLRALRDASGGLGAVDAGALERLLTGWPREDETLFGDVRRVPSGMEATFGRDPVQLREPQRPPIGGAAPTPEGLLGVLREVVGRHARSADTACALSGGLDSATLLSLLAERTDRPLAVSLADGGPADPELEQAKETARSLGARHEVIEVRPQELPALFEEAVLACESPLFNARGVAKAELWRRCAALTGGPLLSGVGADEVLLGHPGVLGTRPGSPAPFEATLQAPRDLARRLLLSPGPARPLETAPVEALGWAAAGFLSRVLPNHTAPLETAAGAAAGVDVRLPFLDESFAWWALSLGPSALVRPWPFECGQLLAGQVLGKRLLREALPRLPAAVRLRPKVPRLAAPGGPDGEARGAWAEVFERLLAPPALEALPGIDAAQVLATAAGYRTLSDPKELAATDHVLMQLASVVVLARSLS